MSRSLTLAGALTALAAVVAAQSLAEQAAAAPAAAPVSSSGGLTGCAVTISPMTMWAHAAADAAAEPTVSPVATTFRGMIDLAVLSDEALQVREIAFLFFLDRLIFFFSLSPATGERHRYYGCRLHHLVDLDLGYTNGVGGGGQRAVAAGHGKRDKRVSPQREKNHHHHHPHFSSRPSLSRPSHPQPGWTLTVDMPPNNKFAWAYNMAVSESTPESTSFTVAGPWGATVPGTVTHVGYQVNATSADFMPHSIRLNGKACTLALAPDPAAPVPPLAPDHILADLGVSQSWATERPISTRGFQFIGVDGAPLTLAGVNWFGFENGQTSEWQDEERE